MKVNRRHFLRNAGFAVATPLVLQQLVACSSGGSSTETVAKTIGDFGIQLWTVKEEMAKDAKGTLKALADYGFKQIESFQGANGVFWGMTPADFKSYTTDLGLSIVSSHVNPEFALKPELLDEFKKLVEDAKSVGITHLINPYLGFLTKLDEFKKATEQFNVLGSICADAGMRYGYHNHHYSFTEMEGAFPQDIMMQGSDADKVDFEMDIYWVHAAKQDPIAWLNKYKERFKLVHIKDMYAAEKITEIQKNEPVNPAFPVNASCLIGQGAIPFADILQVAKNNGVQRFIVEQERFDGTTPLESAKANATYLKAFTLA